MSKPYSLEQFSRQLDDGSGWRRRELSDLKAAISRADSIGRQVLLRALVTMCYAHWEGYVRYASRKYLEFIALKKLRFDELDGQFLKNHFLPRMSRDNSANWNMSTRCDLIDAILCAGSRRFSKVNEKQIDTQSNLNSDVLHQICRVCGLPYDDFAQKEVFLNKFLLARRNSIAHGEGTLVEHRDLDFMVDEVLGLITMFRNAVENQAYSEAYKLPPTAPPLPPTLYKSDSPA